MPGTRRLNFNISFYLNSTRRTYNFALPMDNLIHHKLFILKVRVGHTSRLRLIYFLGISLILIFHTLYKFPLAPMGVLAPRSAHGRPSARPPIDLSGNFPAHVSAESPSNISPNNSEGISEVSEH